MIRLESPASPSHRHDSAQSAAAAKKAPGTALIPYEDPEKMMFRDLRERGYRAPARLYWPLKLVRTALLLIAFLCFAGGLYDTVSWGAHKLAGTPLTGTVAALEPVAEGLVTPVVDYTLPLDGSQWRVASRLPRSDLAVGDSIAVSVIPGSEGLTRIERSNFWRMTSIVALVGGALAIWALVAFWPAVESALGWRRQRENRTSHHLGYATAAGIVALLALTIWMRAVHMPWLGVSEYGSLLTAPDEVMRKAALRCGPSATGPLNPCELRVLGFNGDAAPGAYRRALEERDYESLARYNAAIANPDINFRVDWAGIAPTLLERDPAVLAALLSSGAAPPPEIAFDLKAIAETRGWADVTAALEKQSRAVD